MGRLDDVYQELQGNKPKSSSGEVGAAASFGVQTVTPIAKPVVKAPEPTSEPRDFGTKKDPEKLRKQVLPAHEEGDIINELLKDPIEGVDLKGAHTSAHRSAHTEAASEGRKVQLAGSTSKSLHDRAKFVTGAGFNQSKFTRRLGRYVIDNRMTHISKEDLGKFIGSVAKHARMVGSGHGLDRSARLRIKSELTGQWKAGTLSRTSMRSFKDMLGKL